STSSHGERRTPSASRSECRQLSATSKKQRNCWQNLLLYRSHDTINRVMDIEKLTKSQIVLLTLLVSFVTSIATGIVTVSLMDQAPPAIAQSVSRIVEHTVE